jgi:putative ABC transport system substrate-binding protein
MMDRRAFVTGTLALLAAPFATDAQQAARLPRIGILRLNTAADPLNELLRQALRDVGYLEGQNITIEWRFADERADRLPGLAAELVRLKPDAIVTAGDAAIRAARQATTTIPIVAGTDDLVGEGHVASLSRPGGNVTGVSILAPELNGKRLELLKEAVPSASRVVVLWDPATGTFHLPALETVARSLRVELKILQVRHVGDLEGAFKAARAWRAEAVNVLASPLLNAMRTLIIDQTARYRLPAIYQWDDSARIGGLMAYGPTLAGYWRLVMLQLDRVLKGARPADLPVQQPTKFELVIHLKTAKALGLTIPPSLLARADEVIE